MQPNLKWKNQKIDLASIKLDVDDLSNDKLTNVPVDLKRLSNVVEIVVVKKTVDN